MATLDVTAYAAGDGDLAMVRRAVAAWKVTAGVAGIHFPAGTYILNGQIDLGGCHGMTVSGDGMDLTVLTAATAVNALFRVTTATQGLTFRDLGFTGSVPSPPDVPCRSRPACAATFQHAVQLDGAGVPTEPSNPLVCDVVVTRCAVRDCPSLPIFLRGISGRAEVSDCVFENTMDLGFVYCTNVLCTRNLSRNSADNGFSISRGCRKAIVTDNHVEGCAHHGIWIAGFVINTTTGPAAGSDTGPQNFVCAGNCVTNAGRSGIALSDAPRYGTVTGNMVDGVSRGDRDVPSDNYGIGIYVTGYPSLSPNALTDYADGLVIANNALFRCAKGGIFLRAGVHNSKIDGNLVIDPGSPFLADGVTPVPAADPTNNFGISIDYPATHANLDVANNTVVETRAPGSRWSNFAVVVPPTVPGIRAAGNCGILTADVVRAAAT